MLEDFITIKQYLSIHFLQNNEIYFTIYILCMHDTFYPGNHHLIAIKRCIRKGLSQIIKMKSDSPIVVSYERVMLQQELHLKLFFRVQLLRSTSYLYLRAEAYR